MDTLLEEQLAYLAEDYFESVDRGESLDCEICEPELNKYFAVIERAWEILPWYFKARIYLACTFYYWRYRLMQLLVVQA